MKHLKLYELYNETKPLPYHKKGDINKMLLGNELFKTIEDKISTMNNLLNDIENTNDYKEKETLNYTFMQSDIIDNTKLKRIIKSNPELSQKWMSMYNKWMKLNTDIIRNKKY